MRIILNLFAATLILLAATSCKQKQGNTTEQEQTDKRQYVQPDETTPADSTIPKTIEATQAKSAAPTPAIPIATTTTIWQRIETYVNTSTRKDGPVPSEVMATMGKEWHYTITQLWFMVQFNIKKKLSKGVKGLTEANFDDKYEEQYDIAIRGGY